MKKKKRRFNFKKLNIHLNIGTAIFGIIFIYLIITLILFATKKNIETYQVIAGPLSGNETYTALIVRDEEVVTSSSSGYVNYFINESSKISKNDVVCCVSESKDVNLNKTLDNSDYSEMRNLSAKASNSYDNVNYDDIYSLQYSLSNVMWDSEALMASAGNFYNASTDGIVSCYLDGYEYFTENDLTSDMGQNKGYNSERLNNQDKVEVGTELYKIVKSETWTIYFPITDAQTLSLASIQNLDVKVKFLTDNNTETGKLSFLTNGEQRFGKITLTSGMYRYIDERFIDVEIVSNIQTGLKIPVSSVVTKDFYTVPSSYLTQQEGEDGLLKETRGKDGTNTTSFVPVTVYESVMPEGAAEELYYIDKSLFDEGDIIIKPDSNTRYTIRDTATLEGVYCVNKGYAVFRKIEILDKNNEFCIVKERTSYGLSLYDYIVKDGTSVDENDIVA